MDRTQIPSYGALLLIAELEACGVTVNPNGTVTGKPTVEQLAALKADRDNVIAAAKSNQRDKIMLSWLVKICEVHAGEIVRWQGRRYDMADKANRLLNGYLFGDRVRWHQAAGDLWCAWMAEDSEWYLNEEYERMFA